MKDVVKAYKIFEELWLQKYIGVLGLVINVLKRFKLGFYVLFEITSINTVSDYWVSIILLTLYVRV